MTLGTKLDLDYRERESYRAIFGSDPLEPFRAIADLGMRFIEWPLPPAPDEARIERYAEEAAGFGLTSYFHPYPAPETDATRFSEAPDNPCRLALERQCRLADRIGRRGGYIPVVNLHGGSSCYWEGIPASDEGRELLMPVCVAMFRWLDGFLAAEGLQVLATSEVQASVTSEENFFRIGDRFGEQLALVAEAPGIGLCWDMGHSTMNALRWGPPSYTIDPPAGFLPRVRHVHLHDIRRTPDGLQDHRPLIYGTVVWERHLQALREAGFDGGINLELPPPLVADLGDYRELMARSIARLKTKRQTDDPAGQTPVL